MRLRITTTCKTSIPTQTSTNPLSRVRNGVLLLQSVTIRDSCNRTWCFCHSGLVAVAVFAFLTLHDARVVRGQSTLFGVKIGMSADRVLRVLRKPEDVLESVPYITGKKIINDTLPLTFCKLDFRRSLAFDSSGALAVIGLTHKTTISQMMNHRDCAMQWLVNQYGAPIGESQRDGIRVSLWNVSGAKLTLEARAYNESEAFVLIYFYHDSSTATGP